MARRCPYCGSFVSEEATTCKRCGKTLAIAPSPAPQSPETASAKKKPDAGKTTRKPPARPSQKPLPARPGSPKKTKEHKVPKETASQGPPEEQALKPDFPALDLEQARKAYPHLAEALANYISAYKKVLRESEHHKETITDYREDHDRSKRFNLRKVCIGIFQIDKKGCKKGKETKETLVSMQISSISFFINRGRFVISFIYDFRLLSKIFCSVSNKPILIFVPPISIPILYIVTFLS